MKKTVLSVLIIFLVCFSFVSCDEDKETNESNNSANETQQIATIKGEAFETEDFSVTIADGFSKMTIEGGVQAYKGNDVIEIWVRGSNVPESEAKNATEQLSKANDGTEPQKTEKFGMDFYYTSFEAFGNPQTIYVAVNNGKKIQIGITGKGHQDNETLQGMFDTITFK